MNEDEIELKYYKVTLDIKPNSGPNTYNFTVDGLGPPPEPGTFIMMPEIDFQLLLQVDNLERIVSLEIDDQLKKELPLYIQIGTTKYYRGSNLYATIKKNICTQLNLPFLSIDTITDQKLLEDGGE